MGEAAAIKRHTFFYFGGHFQATAAWQWFNKDTAEVAADKKLLRINMDETSIRLYPGAVAGLVVRRALSGELVAPAKRPLHHATRGQRRGAFTLVAFICDDVEVQKVLPQIIVAAAPILSKSMAAAVQPRLARNVYVIRRKSAWVNTGLLVEIMKLVGKILKPWAATHQPVLLFDALPAHLAPEVLRTAGNNNLWTIVIPAKMTGLLQPLDTDAFAKCKAFLRSRYRDAAVASGDGKVTTEQILQDVNELCHSVLGLTNWACSFDKNGFQPGQGNVRLGILESLNWTSCPDVGAKLPSLEQLRDIWPARGEVNLHALFHQFTRHKSHRPADVVAETLSPRLEDDCEEDSWVHRLRPRKRNAPPDNSSAAAAIAQVPAEASSSNTACPPPLPPPAMPPPLHPDRPQRQPSARRLGPPLPRRR